MNSLMRLTLILLGFTMGGSWALAEIPIQSNDAKILGVIAVIDQNEIHMAQLAEQKNIGQPIRDYARMLDRQHNENLDQLRKIAQAIGLQPREKSMTIDKLRANGQKDLAVLSPLDQDNFSREYISDMIKGHSDALTWLDGQSTANSRIKDFLNATRRHVAMHLKKAQRLQEQVLR